MKRSEFYLDHQLSSQVAELFRDMEQAYDKKAESLDFSCSGCPDNCCDSYFLHHTYIEWLYLWEGLKTLEEHKLEHIAEKAARYVVESEAALARGARPVIMCPVNIDGLCSLYSYRLMICRLHGIPSTLTRPDGQKLNFPGCFRCQEQMAQDSSVVPLERTEFFKRLVELELRLCARAKTATPRIRLTIAQMIVKGPPPAFS